MAEAAPFSIRQVQDAAMLPEQHLSGMQRLLGQYADILVDDFTPASDLLKNTLACIPYLWLLIDGDGEIQAIAGLTRVLPGSTACLHGAASTQMSGHAALNSISQTVFRYAFDVLGLHKLKAVFDADNKGALGFCRRWRFTREDRLPGKTRKGNENLDMLCYALCGEIYQKLPHPYI